MREQIAALLTACLIAAPVAADPCYRPVKKVVVAEPVFVAVPTQINLFQWIAAPTAIAPVQATIAATPAQASAPPPLVAPDDGLPVALLPGQSATVYSGTGPLVQQYMTGACMRCHGGGVTKGNVSLFDLAGRYAPGPARQQIVKAILDGRMPPGGGAPADTKAIVQRWASEP